MSRRHADIIVFVVEARTETVEIWPEKKVIRAYYKNKGKEGCRNYIYPARKVLVLFFTIRTAGGSSLLPSAVLFFIVLFNCHQAFMVNYLACSRARVAVVWSHTSEGPKYWMGPGYT